MKFSLEQEILDQDKCDSQRTSSIIATIANSINSNIQVTTDYPEANIDRKMPVLDLKIWVDYSNVIPKVSYTFYKKPISSP